MSSLPSDPLLFAGMPSITLTDVAQLRVESISFFLVLFFFSALIVKLLWNYLRRDFSKLPYLSYGRSVGIVTVWGLAFVLVLTMISGARELLTPGAWQRDGLTHKLVTSPEANIESIPTDSERRAKLQSLFFALQLYAKDHEGKFPIKSEELPQREVWQLPGERIRTNYRYVAPQGTLQVTAPLAFEPEVFGNTRFVLFGDGRILKLESDELERLLMEEKKK